MIEFIGSSTRTGVRADDDDAQGCGRLLSTGFLDEILLVAGETGQPVDDGAGRVVHGRGGQVHGEFHLALRHIAENCVHTIVARANNDTKFIGEI
jgi:hypothetical protein